MQIVAIGKCENHIGQIEERSRIEQLKAGNSHVINGAYRPAGKAQQNVETPFFSPLFSPFFSPFGTTFLATASPAFALDIAHHLGHGGTLHLNDFIEQCAVTRDG